jgi:hypothetical protein
MKQMLLLLTAVLVFSPSSTIRGTQRGDAPLLEVTVRRADNSAPIVGARVVASAAGIASDLQALTDDGGRAVFRDLPTGMWRIRAAREGYYSTNPVNTSTQAETSVSVSAGTATYRASLVLTPGGVIAGRILGTEGRLASDVQITIQRLMYNYWGFGNRVLVTQGQPVSPSAGGDYRITGLAPGDYYLQAEFRVRGNPPAASAFAPTFYPGTTSVSSAVPLSIRGGEELSPIDWALRPSGGFRISGTVVAPPGLGITQPNGALRRVMASIYLARRNPSPLSEQPRSFSNVTLAKGEGNELPFEIQGVEPGIYDIYPAYRVQDERNPNDLPTYLTAPTRIEVRDRSVERLVLNLRSGVVVNGRVVLRESGGSSSGRAFDFTQMEMRLRPKQPIPNLVLPPVQSGNLKADGTVSIPNVYSGEYRLEVLLHPARGAYISDVRHSGRSIVNDPTVVISEGHTDPIEVVLTRGGGTVRGMLADVAGRSVVGARVILVPQGNRRNNPMFYRSVNADERGQFVFLGVAPGQYKVVPGDRIPTGAEFHPDVLARFDTASVSVQVVSAEEVTIQLRQISESIR